MLIDLTEKIVPLMNSPEYPMRELYNVLGEGPVTPHPKEPGVLVGMRNLGNVLHDILFVDPNEPEHQMSLLRPRHKAEFTWPSGRVQEIEEDGQYFEIPAGPGGSWRQVYGVAASLEDILRYFEPEVNDPDRFYVIGVVYRDEMPEKDGPYISDRTAEGDLQTTDGKLLLFHLYELNPEVLVKRESATPQESQSEDASRR